MTKKFIKAAIISAIYVFSSLSLLGQNTPQNVLDTLNEQGDLGIAVLADISHSTNTTAGQPVEYMIDGDESTWYGMNGTSSYGWVRLDFEEEVYIDEVTISGNIPEGTVFYLQTEIDEKRVTFPAGYIAKSGSSFTLDLTRDRLLTDNLIFVAEGDTLSSLRIYEMSLHSSSKDGELNKKTLELRDKTYSKKSLNNNFTLIDGKIGTVWKNSNRGFGSMIYWLYQNVIQGQYHAYNDWKTKDEIILDIPNYGEMEFLKFYLTLEACGELDIEANIGDVWNPLAHYQLSTLSGWQKLDLSGLGEITSLKLILEDPSVPWQQGNYGGIGELELWGRTNPEKTEIVDLISPSLSYDTTDTLFQVPNLDEKKYKLQIVTDGTESESPVLFVNGNELSLDESMVYPGIKVWDFSLPNHFLKLNENSLKIQSDAERIFSADLLLSSRDTLPLSETSLSDGRRYSGRTSLSEPALFDLFDGQAEMEEIILYYRENNPGDLYIQNNGISNYLNALVDSENKKVFRGRNLLDKIGLDFLNGVQEIEVKGSQNVVVNPYIELLFPLQNVELPQYTTYSYKVIGITDTPDGEITVNGVPAQVHDNFFWVEMRDLHINDAGSHLIEAKVLHSNGNEATDSALIQIESDSNSLYLDQEDHLYTTIDSTFTISGRITGYERDLRINSIPVSVPNSRRFSYDFPLEMGLNIIMIELMSLDGNDVLVREMRQVYRQDLEPSLSITTPSDNSMTNQDFITVAGKVSPWGLESVNVNGLNAALSGESFSCTGVPITDLVNSIRVQASYETGVVAEKTISVTKDQTAPIITNVLPAPGTPIGDDYVIITGNVEEENQVSVFVNGLIANVVGDNFSVIVPLPVEGDNIIRVSAQDEAGNSADWPQFTVFRDNFGPEPFDIDISPSDWTSERRPTIQFETIDTGIGLSHYEVSVNGGSFINQVSPYQLPNLPEGEIPITVRAYDLFGNTTDSTVYAKIDTVSPDDPGNFRIVPGNDRVILKWEEDDSETMSYIVGQVDSETEYTVFRSDYISEDGGVLSLEKAIEGLESSTDYEFYIIAIDHAGNIGSKVIDSATTSMVVSDLESNGYSEVEYDGITLTIPQGALPKEVDKIIMREVIDDYISDTSTNPIVSPIYSFSVGSDEGDEGSHINFEKPFVGVISYEPSDDWEDIPEKNLAVYYYDEIWGRWFLTDENIVDTENNTITFATDHFSEFSVQPTSQDTIDYRQWKNIEYPLTSDSTSHSPIAVSEQGGSASTSMTEFILPGLNGMDLAIKRTYSTTIADSDSTLLPLNTMTEIQNEKQLNESSEENGNEDVFAVSPSSGLLKENSNNASNQSAQSILEDYLSSPARAINSWNASRYKQTMYKRAELSYSVGQGWRLDMPYIRYADSYVTIYIPGEGSFSTNELQREDDSNTGNISYFDSLEGKCRITLRREKISGDANESSITRYQVKNVDVYTNNGYLYEFTDTGLIDHITDVYGNSIEYLYDSNLRLQRINDTRKRAIFFTYYNDSQYQNFLPVLKNIVVFDKNAAPTDGPLSEEEIKSSDMKVTYQYDTSSGAAGLPLLLNALDVAGRKWDYSYGKIYLKTRYKYDEGGVLTPNGSSSRTPYYPNRTKTQYIFPIISVSGPGVGYEKVTYGKAWSSQTNGLSSVDINETYKYIGKSEELEDRTEVLAVHKVETYDSDLGVSENLRKVTSYSYNIEDEGWIKRTTRDDSKLKEVFSFNEITFKIDQPDTDKHFLWFKTGTNDNIDDVDSVLQTAKQTYVKRDGSYVLTRNQSISYYDEQRLRKTVTTRFGPYANSLYAQESYVYDDYGNILKLTEQEMNVDITSTRTTWNWYTSSPSLPSGVNITDTPFDTYSLNSRIKDRVKRTYSTIVTIDGVNRTELPTEVVYSYNLQGSMTGRAELYGSGVNTDWSINRYEYSENGELIKRNNPFGQETDISYDYSFDDYDLVTTIERSIPDENRNPVDRISSLQKDKLGGWIIKEIRPDGAETVYNRDSMGRIIQVTKPKDTSESASPTIYVKYDDINMTVKQIDPLGNYQIYSFNNRGEIEKIAKYNSSDNLLQVTVIEQDYYGNVAAVITPGGDRLEYDYDGLGRILEERYEEEGKARSVTYSYYPETSETIRVNEIGNRQIIHSDTRGRALETQDLTRDNYILRSTKAFYNIRGDLLSQKDGNGNWFEFYYDRQGQILRTVSPEAEFYENGEDGITGNVISSKEYNLLGLVTREYVNLESGSLSELINEKLFSYDNLGRLEKETVPYTDFEGTSYSSQIEHFYDKLDREVRLTDSNDNSWEKEYTARGQLSKETNPLGAETTYFYDLKDRPISLTDARENSGSYTDYRGTLSYRYDDLDRLIEGDLPVRTGEESRIIKFSYDEEGNLLSRVEPDGGATVYSYTEQNRVKTETKQDNLTSPTVSYETVYSYDEMGNLTGVVHPDGSVETYAYDEVNRKVQESLPEGVTRSYLYDKNDNLKKQVNGRGFEQYYSYDSLNRMIKYTDESSEIWLTGYNAQGAVSRTVDPNNVIRKNLYDERGSLIKEIDGQNHISLYSYDPMGNLSRKVDPRGTEITYSYRADNLPVSVTYSNGDEDRSRTLSYSYDESGALMNASDKGITTYYNDYGGLYIPDPLNQITRRTTTGYNDVLYHYDNMDRLTSLTNGKHSSVSYEYNSLGQLTSIPGFMTDISYNKRGLLEGYTLDNGMTMTRDYDSRARLSNLNYSYDGISLKSYNYFWDKADNLVDENGNLYAYDARDRLAMAMFSMEMDQASEAEVDLTDYNNTDYLASVENDVLGDGELTEVEVGEEFRLDWGARSIGVDMGYPYYIGKIVLNVADGENSRITDDTVSVYTAMSNRDGQYVESAISTFTLSPDEGTITLELDTPIVARYVKVNSFNNSRDGDYAAIDDSTLGLDQENPLTIFKLEGGAHNEFYLYDGKGNRTKKTIMDSGTVISPYTYYENSDWLENDGTYEYTYDGNGNLIEKVSSELESSDSGYEQWEYSYDLRNRLEKVSSWDSESSSLTIVATYTYDVDGYRIEKESGDGIITNYVFDLSGNMIEEIVGGVSSRYVFMGSTHIAKIAEDGSREFFGTNHLGSTTLIISEDGTPVLDDETNPFGDQENKEIFYTGKQWDEDSQLYYFNARWYDPYTARFLTEDPVKDGLLWYAYANNNPMKFTDPTGLSVLDDYDYQQRTNETAKKNSSSGSGSNDSGSGSSSSDNSSNGAAEEARRRAENAEKQAQKEEKQKKDQYQILPSRSDLEKQRIIEGIHKIEDIEKALVNEVLERKGVNWDYTKQRAESDIEYDKRTGKVVTEGLIYNTHVVSGLVDREGMELPVQISGRQPVPGDTIHVNMTIVTQDSDGNFDIVNKERKERGLAAVGVEIEVPNGKSLYGAFAEVYYKSETGKEAYHQVKIRM